MKKSKSVTIERPTATWREDLADGESILTEEQIAAVDRILDDFLARLAAPPTGDEENAIMLVLQTTVEALNVVGGLGGQMGNFLETDEREDLVPFLLNAARRAGLALKKGEDPTAAWREW